MSSDLKGKAFRSHTENSSNILNGLFYYGTISLSSEFPLKISTKVRYVWEILADVTDDDPAKTNTGQSFLENDIIMWNGKNWDVLGNAFYDLKHHHPQHEILGDDIVDIDGGGF